MPHDSQPLANTKDTASLNSEDSQRRLCNAFNFSSLTWSQELKTVIFSSFGVENTKSISLCCKDFLRVIRSIIGFKRIWVTPDNIRSLAKCKGLLKTTKLDFDYNLPEDDYALLAGARNVDLRFWVINDNICKAFAGAQIVSVASNKVTDVGICALAAGGVQNLELSDLDKLTVASFKALAQSGTLKSIVIEDCPGVNDECLEALAGIPEITLYNVPVTDKGVRALAGAKNIYIKNCPDVTADGIAALAGAEKAKFEPYPCTFVPAFAGIRSIDLSFNDTLTDDLLKCLAGVHEIKLRYCKQITDEGVKALAGVHTIDLLEVGVTDEGLKALAGVHNITLGVNNYAITDKGLKALAGVHTFHLEGCPKVTDAGVAVLAAGAYNIHLEGCSHLSGAALKGFTKAEEVYISNCMNITEGMEHISGARKVTLIGVGIKSLRYLINVEKLRVDCCPNIPNALLLSWFGRIRNIPVRVSTPVYQMFSMGTHNVSIGYR